MKIEYPTTKQLSDGEQFAEIFKQLCTDKVKSIDASKLGVVTIYFKDGTTCGGMWLWRQAGFGV